MAELVKTAKFNTLQPIGWTCAQAPITNDDESSTNDEDGEAEFNRITEIFGTTYDKARLASLAERSTMSEREKQQVGGSLTYGEVTYSSMNSIFQSLQAHGLTCGAQQEDSSSPPSLRFFDLGSGNGRSTLAAIIAFPHFKHAVGIEILDSLFQQSLELKRAWEIADGASTSISSSTSTSISSSSTTSTTTLPLSSSSTTKTKTTLEFIKGSILDLHFCDWTVGDVVFANSTCFSDDMMTLLADMGSSMKKGAFFVTFTTKLKEDIFKVVEEMRMKMSWGEADVFVHVRV